MKIEAGKLTHNAANSSFEALMGGENNRIVDIPIDDLVATENQPFRVVNDERMRILVDDIKINGVLEPILVIAENGKYRILAGHRRTAASRLAGKETVPAIIQNGKKNEKLIIVNTNLPQRETFLPSELAKAYKLQQEGYKEENKSLDQMASDTGSSKRMIQYYIKLNNLIEQLLELVDQKIITVKAGAKLSILDNASQKTVFDFIIKNKIKKIDEIEADNIAANNRYVGYTSDAYLCALFLKGKGKKEDNYKYDSYIIGTKEVADIKSGISDICSCRRLIDSTVLTKTEYIKFTKAKEMIEKQLKAIQKILDKK